MGLCRKLVVWGSVPVFFFAVLPHLLFLLVRTEFTTVQPKDALVFVTGCSSGLGRNYVRSAVAQGYAVLASVRKEKDAAALREEFKGQRVRPILLDITNEEQRVAAVETMKKVAEEWKVQPYALINNAGSGGFGPMEGKDLEETKWTFEVLYHAPIRLANLVRPVFAQYKTGRILFVGSTTDRLGMSLSALYSSAKAAVHTAALVMRNEWAFQGIAVTLLYQGPATTEYMNTNVGDTLCTNKVASKEHADKYCKWQAENMREQDIMPLPSSPMYFLFDAIPQARVAIDHLSSQYPEPEIYTNIPGRLMCYVALLPENLKEHMFRVK